MNDIPDSQPQRIINCVAPIRICDNGGWTDTWFAKSGKIFNIGVYPYVEVQVEVFRNDAPNQQIVVFAENYGQSFAVTDAQSGWGQHPLLQAAIARMKVPADVALKVTIFSEAPSGASTGTSAAVAVALVGALDRLTRGHLTAHEVAYTAQAIETEMLKLQCGIQDQLCSAFGGINYIEMFDYPRATVSQIQIRNAIWWELERRLVLIYFGKSHSSSAVHEKVIRELEGSGPGCRKLQDLRATAEKSRDAVHAGDFVALGRAMIRDIETENPMFKNIPVYLSRYGLRTWDRQAERSRQ